MKPANLALLIFLTALGPTPLTAQAVVGVLPNLNGVSSYDQVFLSRTAEAMRIGLQGAGITAVAPTMDPSTVAILKEIYDIGDSGAETSYAKLAKQSHAEEFVLLNWTGTSLTAEWRNAKGETKSGAAVKFQPNFDRDTDLLIDMTRRLLVPDLTRVPYRPPFEVVPYLIPGWGHFEKGYPLEGALMAGVGATAIFGTVWSLRTASVNQALSAQASNNTNAKFYYDQAQSNTYLALGCVLVYGLDAIWSGMTNAGLKERRLRELVVWKE